DRPNAAGISQTELVALGACRRDVNAHPITLKPIQEFRQGDPRRVHGCPGFDLGDQPCTFDLGLALGSPERMPTAPALAGLWITRVEDDRPMARASLLE